ncbi:MAG: LacI family transcriptional regulator [Hyphomicrobiales bacterium]|nr:LacI family transcriptional regulator [Hyphomicrobiales bacterium]
MVRLIEVAKAAGVSRSTVSNVFNNPEIVRPKLRKRVETAARELGYAGPDPKGRLLRDGKYNAIAVMPPSDLRMVETISNPVMNQLMQGIGEVCDEHGANLVVISGASSRDGVGDALVDGVIFSRIDQLAEIETARLRRMRYAVVDFDPGPNIHSVRVDAYAGSYQAAKHLVELGHRRFAILSFLRVAGPTLVHPQGQSRPPEAAGSFTDQEKLRGYADALDEIRIKVDNVPMVQADAHATDAPAMMLDAAPEATAFLSMSVMQGIGLIEEAQRRGLSVPGDLSVIGYNDTRDAARCSPPLTTVDSMLVQKGREAARLIYEDGPPQHKIIKPDLIIRGSTGPAPAES